MLFESITIIQSSPDLSSSEDKEDEEKNDKPEEFEDASSVDPAVTKSELGKVETGDTEQTTPKVETSQEGGSGSSSGENGHQDQVCLITSNIMLPAYYAYILNLLVLFTNLTAHQVVYICYVIKCNSICSVQFPDHSLGFIILYWLMTIYYESFQEIG